MKIQRTLCLWLLLCCLNTVAQVEFKKTASGAEYKILSHGQGRKIKLTDIVTFHFIENTDQDTLLYNTYENSEPFKTEVHPSKHILDLMDVFINLRENDSVLIFIRSDLIFKDNQIERPYYLPKGSSIVFYLKIEKVQTQADLIAKNRKASKKEMSILKKYLKEKKIKPQYTRSGLIFLPTKQTQSAKPQPGDTVYIDYVASTLGGIAFDTNILAEAKKWGIEKFGKEYGPICFEVCETGEITPWDEGIMMMNEDSKATFILPSSIAFGAQGFGSIIKPFTTFIIEVEIKKIQKRHTQPDRPSLNQNKYLTDLYIRPGKFSQPLIYSLRSVLFLTQKFHKDAYSKGKTPGAQIPWVLRWYDIAMDILVKGRK